MSDSVIRLNVGGVHYDTTKSTLCRISGSMLESMFSGSIPSQKVKGRYFIDRDGALFQYILRYLRDGELWTPPSNLDLCQDLLREAQFFCLSPLIQILETTIRAITIKQIGKAFAIRINTHHKISQGYSNLPQELSDWQYKGFYDTVEACDRIINQAKALGYTLTSIVKGSDDFWCLTFESK